MTKQTLDQTLKQTLEQKVSPETNPVPSRPIGNGYTESPRQSVSLVPTSRESKVYRTVGEELAAYYTRFVDAEYAEHLAAMEADVQRIHDYRKGELERWRDKTIRRMCEGLDV